MSSWDESKQQGMTNKEFLVVSLLLALGLPLLFLLQTPDLLNKLLDGQPHKFKPASFNGHQVWRIQVDEPDKIKPLWEMTEVRC